MAWGEPHNDQVTVWSCGVEGCGHKVLGPAVGGSCPTHRTPLIPILYERVRPPLKVA